MKDEHPGWDGRAVTKYLAEKWEELKKDHSAEADKFQVEADEANKDFEVRTKEFFSSPVPRSSPRWSKPRPTIPSTTSSTWRRVATCSRRVGPRTRTAPSPRRSPRRLLPRLLPRRLVPSLPSQLPSRCALPRLRLPRRLWRPTRARMTIWSWSESVKCVSV